MGNMFEYLHQSIIEVVFVIGNWAGEGKFKMWFTHGGAIEFGKAMLTAAKMGKTSVEFCRNKQP